LKRYEVQALLSVRPRGTTRAAEPKPDQNSSRNTRAKTSADPETKSAKHIENQANQIANLKKRLEGGTTWGRKPKTQAGKGKGSGKSKGKGKTKKKGKGKSKGKSKGKGKKGGKSSKGLPSGLEGAIKTDSNGDAFCYNFNLGNCKRTVTNGKCEKGWHKCMSKGCTEKHAYINHQ
jgi:hypothetical protein